MATLGSSIFVWLFLLPYLYDKYNLWAASRILRKLAKDKAKDEPELAKQLLEIADKTDEVRRDVKL